MAVSVAALIGLLFVQILISSANAYSPKIAAFNIQILGKTKASKTDVMTDLAKMLKNFDITLVQEIREKRSDVAITTLLKLLNQNHENVWAYVQSPPLGSSRSTEQYAYVYNKKHVIIKKTYQYDDSEYNYFEREPFGVLIEINGDEIGLLGIHIKPSNAATEISHLVGVYDDARKTKNLGTDNMFILGDFNAGCGYVSNSAFSGIDLFTDPRFTWLISNDQDTTVARSACPYDRIVMAGNDLAKLVDGKGHVYEFDKIIGLTQEQAEERSDHYPVYVKLYEKVQETIFDMENSFSFTISTPSTLELDLLGTANTVFTHDLISSAHVLQADINCDSIEEKLNDLEAKVPGSVTTASQYLIKAYMSKNVLSFPDVPYIQNLKQKDTCYVVLAFKSGKCVVNITQKSS